MRTLAAGDFSKGGGEIGDGRGMGAELTVQIVAGVFCRSDCERLLPASTRRRVHQTVSNRTGLKPVRTGSGLVRYETGPNSKFKFKLKNEKFLKIRQGAMNLMVSNFLKNPFI